MKNKIKSFRWKLADYLSLFACKLRGQKWYIGTAWHGVPGNRAADLQQQVWQDVVLISVPIKEEDQDARDRILKNLNELAQLAGENWGHICHCDDRMEVLYPEPNNP